MLEMNRRNFMNWLSIGLLTLGVGRRSKAAGRTDEPAFDTASGLGEELHIREYNPLGKTGIKASDIMFGGTSFVSPNVARYAYDLGINVFDCAENYMNGRAEEYLGQAFKGIRDKVHIITKHFGEVMPTQARTREALTKDQLFEKFNNSLKRLQTDYIDGIFFHSLSREEEIDGLVRNEVLLSGYDQLKREGKIRFTGFSTHNPKLFLELALKSELADFVQVVMFIYNHMEGKEIEPLIKRLHQQGIGTIAMKTLAGGQQGSLKAFLNRNTSYPQAALAWILSNPNIDAAVLSMRSFSQVEEYIKASGSRLDRTDVGVLEEYRRSVDKTYCRLSCRECERFCPHGVAVSDIMRFQMYFEDYGQERAAMEHYLALDNGRKPRHCQGCSARCNDACPFGIQVKDRLIRADAVLSV